MDELTKKALNVLTSSGIHHDKPIENVFKDIPAQISVSNCLRFLLPDSYFPGMDRVIITDADLLLFRNSPTLLKWHEKRKISGVYTGHHGPWKKRRRIDVTGPAGWKGKFERVAGGFFMATPQWYKVTAKIRKKYTKKIKAGKIAGYRESDEAMLGNMIKAAHLLMPPFGFCKKQRGVHLGDFKKGMEHRYKSKGKIKSRVAPQIARRFLDLKNDSIWKDLTKVLEADEKLTHILKVARNVLRKRSKS